MQNLSVEDGALYDWEHFERDEGLGVNDDMEVVNDLLSDGDMDVDMGTNSSRHIGDVVRDTMKTELWAREMSDRFGLRPISMDLD